METIDELTAVSHSTVPARCPRCSGRVSSSRDEPVCFTCGWADYAYVAENADKALFKGLLDYARYEGDNDALRGRYCVILMGRGGLGRNGGERIRCPYCGTPATFQSHGYWNSYKCAENHILRIQRRKFEAVWQ